MKVHRLFLALLLVMPVVTLAQDSNHVLVPKSMLTEDQLKRVEGTTPSDVHAWTGVGKEIGSAVNESLSAVTTNANNFAQTPVGKLTAVVVVWKLLGPSIIHTVFGAFFLIMSIPIWIWSYRKTCIDRTVLVETSYDANKKPVKKYQQIPYKSNAVDFTPRVVHWITLPILFGMFLMVTFMY